MSGLGFGVSIPGPKFWNLTKTGSSLTFNMLNVGAQSTLHPSKLGNLFSDMQWRNVFGPVDVSCSSAYSSVHARNDSSHCCKLKCLFKINAPGPIHLVFLDIMSSHQGDLLNVNDKSLISNTLHTILRVFGHLLDTSLDIKKNQMSWPNIFLAIWRLIRHSSEIKGLCST